MSWPRCSVFVAGSTSFVTGLLVTVAVSTLLVGPVVADPAGSAASIEPIDSVSATADTAGTPARFLAPPVTASNTTDIDPDAVVMAIEVAPNGSALWQVSYRLRLEDENATAAFESLQSDIRANETAYTARFARRIDRTVGLAEESTGRSMSAGNVSVETRRESLPQEYGVLTYQFRWFDFARVEGEELLLGDAISGLFLDRQTSLRVEWPDGYRSQSVDPAADETRAGAVVWRGPMEFGDDQPRVTVAEATPVPTDGPATGSETVTTPETEAPGEARNGPPWLLGGLVLLALAAVAIVGYRRRVSGQAGGGSGGSGSGGSGADTGSTPPTDAELLSNEERVLHLLEDNGGRMKQQAVAEELEWTDAKTSQVISDLREAEDVETFRLGRENVVTLPDAGGPIE